VLAITPGEPAGIGPDIAIELCQIEREEAIVLVADKNMLSDRADLLGKELDIVEDDKTVTRDARRVNVIHVPLEEKVEPGVLNPRNSVGVLKSLDNAIGGCLSGRFSGLVTGPIQKSVMNEGGIPFTGHTEYLAERAEVEDVVMMLASEKMRVALATTHLPLKQVPQEITYELLTRRLMILNEALRNLFRIASPRILVSGLNPHSGESGKLGLEEEDVISPVCESLRERGVDLIGPLPADTLFTPKYLDQADSVMAMYHDQGLPVLKYSSFGRAVNITLGLPFVRTSVDHGTALELAGRGIADSSSLGEAIKLAGRILKTGAGSNAS
jgi:4-hydroxythreonine-4-phosphate dehydrogenase